MNTAKTIKSCWQECLFRLKSEISHTQFSTWVQPLKCVTAGNDKIIIQVHAKKIHQFVEKNYWQRICAVFNEYSLPKPILQFCRPAIDNQAESKMNLNQIKNFSNNLEAEKISLFAPTTYNEPLPQSISISSKQLANHVSKPINSKSHLNGNRNPNGLLNYYTFDTFVLGKSNQLARSAALQISEKPGFAYNPFYLYGGVGIGKTHLVHAIGNCLHQEYGYKVRYIHADDYFNEVVKTIRNHSHEEFKKYFRGLDAFIIDDVQFLQNRTRTQEELFYLFNTLMETGRQIIVTSDRFPRDIENLQERLRSRFQWGLTVAIDSPEFELRVEILQEKAKLANVHLDTSCLHYIAKHLKANVRELEGALNKVIAYNHFHKNPINIETIKLALKDIIGHVSQPLTIDHIQKTVADFYKINSSDLHAKSRCRIFVRARQMAMYLARELTTMSLPSIGNAFGGRDHTTVLHACKTMDELRKSQKFNQDYRYLEQVLKGD